MKVHYEGKICMLTIGGVTKTLYAWGMQYGISSATLEYRISAGWNEDALFLKPRGAGRLGSTMEMKKRGCHYCADFKRVCPHRECPYHELDGFNTYTDYLKYGEKNGLVKFLEQLG